MLRAAVIAGFCLVSAGAQILIDYPADGSVFPPDFTSPTFLWRDPAAGAASWRISVTFEDNSPAIRVLARGERMRPGDIDPRCASPNNKPPELTPEQAAAHTWVPDAATWSAIKRHSVAAPATVTIEGLVAGEPVSHGRMRIRTSVEPVGAPIFYRDVPLIPSETEKGVIKPLAQSNIPLIAWCLRDVSQPRSRVVMEDLHTCANCHSFSADGKTLGMDLDGPQNDKGLYTMVPVGPKMTIRNEDVISWTSYRGEFGSQLREAFMSQVSPDGRYVVTTIKPAGGGGVQLYYLANFKDYRFLQVFYPTRGILVWYDRETRKLQPLPGADDPRYVQTNAVWSRDGSDLVFARAEARNPYRPDGKLAAYANDPIEVSMQYDLYRIPFNGGKGGKPEPVLGASRNGMSNSFPKISPDGRWIVFVQARNGEVMRPDSQLYIVPAAGGQARRMTCNTKLMNSWHSFSPNGRWLVFSSKSRSPYTQMYLTHIDAEGRDSPAILIENSTAANRAVNIPEFVNIPAGGIEHIDTPEVEFYRQFDVAADLAKQGDYARAIPEWIKALAMSPGDARAHNNYGLALAGAGKRDDAMEQYRKALAAKPDYAEAHNNLAIALADEGHAAEAIGEYQQALEDKPGYAEAHANLATLLAQQGRLPEALRHFEAALAIRPDYADAHNNFGVALASAGRFDEAAAHYRKAIESDPGYADAHDNLGMLLAKSGKLDEATVHLRKAVELNPADARAAGNLGRTLVAQGKFDEAIPLLDKALERGPETAELKSSLGIALAEKGRMDQALPHLERAVQLNPKLVETRYYLGTALMLKGRTGDGLAQWRQALRTDPDNLQILNDTSWILSTSTDAALRNGSEAVRLAAHAVELTAGREPAILATLAAAYAEAGQFDKAAEVEKRAADMASAQGKTDMAATLRARVPRFEAKTAIREGDR